MIAPRAGSLSLEQVRIALAKLHVRERETQNNLCIDPDGQSRTVRYFLREVDGVAYWAPFPFVRSERALIDRDIIAGLLRRLGLEGEDLESYLDDDDGV